MSVLLIDLDDTLVPDVCARDQAVLAVLRRFGGRDDVAAALAVVREEWRASGLRVVPQLAGVSSWEALWTDFAQAVPGPGVREAGLCFQHLVWRRLVPDAPPESASLVFRSIRETKVLPFPWVPSALADWRAAHTVWCMTNGSAWLQRRKLSLAGLADMFPVVVASADVGAEKAASRFCSYVASRLKHARNEAVAVIGDSRQADGALAQGLGIRFVPVVPGQRPDWTPLVSW